MFHAAKVYDEKANIMWNFRGIYSMKSQRQSGPYINGLLKDCSISIANALEILPALY